MNISQEHLTEANYTNPRMIKLENTQVKELYQKILDIRKEIEPKVKELEEIEKELAPFRDEIQKKQAEIKELSDKAKPVMDKYNEKFKELEQPENEANKIKDKITPLVVEEVNGQLGEFEELVGVEFVDGDMYAKINDKIEETVKVVRQRKQAVDVASK